MRNDGEIRYGGETSNGNGIRHEDGIYTNGILWQNWLMVM
jgi:hypothetical protein